MTSGIDEIDFSASFLDSREIEARIDWLESELADEQTLTYDEREELTALRTLRDELQGYAGDWRYGATLVSDGYRQDYAREYAQEVHGESLTALSDDLRECIDWEKWAEEFFDSDWAEASITFRGTEYNFTVRM